MFAFFLQANQPGLLLSLLSLLLLLLLLLVVVVVVVGAHRFRILRVQLLADLYIDVEMQNQRASNICFIYFISTLIQDTTIFCNLFISTLKYDSAMFCKLSILPYFNVGMQIRNMLEAVCSFISTLK